MAGKEMDIEALDDFACVSSKPQKIDILLKLVFFDIPM